MLYPQSNPFRQVVDLSGYWDFRFDPQKTGTASGWFSGFDGGRIIAVPASWNDQFEDGRDYLGDAWYQTRFDCPRAFAGERVFLRFGSANYYAEAWLNGQRLGDHEGGHLPFEFNITGQLQPESNRLVVRVEGELAPDRVPPGNIPADPMDSFGSQPFPNTNFDFFPFCGLHRPVLLYSVPQAAIRDISVVTNIKGSDGMLRVTVESTASTAEAAQFYLHGHGANVEAKPSFSGQYAETVMVIPNASFWEPGAPNLYDLTVELLVAGAVVDRYSLPVGIRVIQIDGDRLLLNEKPVFLAGFCRHEDFPVVGRGYLPALVVKDFALMDWIGANSFRTTHYPYSEQTMDLADRLGFLVIDETPAVGLFFSKNGLERRLELCKQYTHDLIDRDKNHPSVIAWSLANEPHSLHPEAKSFFRQLYDLAKSKDATRPVTLVSQLGIMEESFEFLDFVCLNRYYGWYTHLGRIDEGVKDLDGELDYLHEKFAKPIILSEFGTDTIPGQHAQPPEMFSEEYQAEFITQYLQLLKRKPYVVGAHIWNLCDFKTGQAVHRMGGYNYKGLFTRDRRPKLAAHQLRKLWKNI